MPELPEVEIIRRGLAKEIIGRKIDRIKITGVRRRAKLLIIDLADKTSLIFHLKLTGQLLFNSRPGKYTRAVFNFDDGANLIFNDARKFGWWKKIKDTSLIEKQFGPEPLGRTFTLKKLRQIAAKRKKSKIKPLLMDQKFIAGIGNIYADEILFASGIHPLRRAGTLNKSEIEKLFKAIKTILKAAVKQSGSSIRDYLDVYGEKGEYASCHKVYQKQGSKCSKCGSAIKRIKIGSRSAHFCPRCQKI